MFNFTLILTNFSYKLRVYKEQDLETDVENIVPPEVMPLQAEDSCDTDCHSRNVYMYVFHFSHFTRLGEKTIFN